VLFIIVSSPVFVVASGLLLLLLLLLVLVRMVSDILLWISPGNSNLFAVLTGSGDADFTDGNCGLCELIISSCFPA